MSTIGIDIGTRRIGLVDGSIEDGVPVIHVADVLSVSTDLRSTVYVDLLAWLRTWDKPDDVVIEHSPRVYMPTGCTPQQGQRIAEAWHTGCVLRDHVVALCAEHGIAVRTYTDTSGVKHNSIPRQAWAHRILPGHSGGISQSAAREAVGAYLSEDSLSWLVGDDRLDAAGALLWAILPDAPRKHGRRRRGGEPREPRPVLTAEEKRAAAYAAQRVRRGVAPALAPPEGLGGASNCGRCGGPRRGHLRGLPCPPLPAGLGPPTGG